PADPPDLDQDNGSIRILDAATGSMSRLTFGSWNDTSGSWSPDGTRIVYGSAPKGPVELYIKSVNGGEAELLVETAHWKYPESWSPDGQSILYREIDPNTRGDLW